MNEYSGILHDAEYEKRIIACLPDTLLLEVAGPRMVGNTKHFALLVQNRITGNRKFAMSIIPLSDKHLPGIIEALAKATA